MGDVLAVASFPQNAYDAADLAPCTVHNTLSYSPSVANALADPVVRPAVRAGEQRWPANLVRVLSAAGRSATPPAGGV